MSSWTVTKHSLHAPALQELVPTVINGLEENFADVKVAVVQCPDLRKTPFSLAGPGICGGETVADIGGPPNLFPTPKLDRIYSHHDIMRLVEYRPLAPGLLIGASAGPFTEVGVNSELTPNYYSHGCKRQNATHCTKIDDEKQQCDCFPLRTRQFGLMGNLFISRAEQGDVLHVVAKHRTGISNFTAAIQSALRARYGDQPVSLGGVFVIKTGKAKLHVMPDFNKEPLQDREAVEAWLRYFEMSSPITCLTVFHSADPENLGLRMEHTHCFSAHGEGGHYHEDTTPEEVEYEAYLNVAKVLYRIDKPE